MNPNPSRPPPLHWLTVLRYPATVWVLMKHSLHNFGDSYAVPESLRRDFMERGFLGVPFFFILSGFILTYNYPVIARKRDYLAARAGRILPLYYLSLLFSAPMLVEKFAKEGLSFMLPRVIAFLTLTQAWIPDFHSIWNFPAWTLSCEVFFYTLLLVLLPFLQRLIAGSTARTFSIIAGCFLLGLINPAIFSHYHGNPSSHALDDPANGALISASNFVKIFPIWHLTEFASGVALCIGMRSRLPALSHISGWLILLGVLQVLSSLCVPVIYAQGSYCLPGFVLIILGAAALPFPQLNTSRPWARSWAMKAVLLGNASYAVYLFHVPIIYYLTSANRHVLHLLPTGEKGVWSLFCADLLLTTVLAIFLHFLYEQPARKWLAARIRRA